MRLLISILWICTTAILVYIPSQSDFLKISLPYTVLFGLYLFSYRYFRSHSDVLFLIFLSVVVRFVTVFAFPNLSDDIYRFLWDGHLLNDGINPFLYTPSEWLSVGNANEALSALYPRLNSPEYYSIYPPVCQGLFAFVTWLFPTSPYWASVALKLVFLFSEIGTIYILMKFVQQLGLPLKRVLLYALNPLIIVELCGNLHFEAIMIFFMIAGLWFFARKRHMFFGILFGLSILTKLLPLMFLPFLLLRAHWKNILVGFGAIAITLLVGFSSLIDLTVVEKFASSLDLYFRKFEFNASIYYLAREVGYWYRGYNMIASIGPWLSVIALVAILSLALFERKRTMRTFFESALLAFTIYLLLTTTIHPWYLALPIVLCIFTRFRYPLFWSGLITLTYINYWGDGYHERMGIVVLEYICVLTLLYLEVFRVPMVRSLAIRFLRFFRSLRP
ncbi:MAG: DUF2029 domain-containing protein [Saprospiraceae bacterium]|nr:DUF2029 domain-containing protein [Saprospiraceae bacterium]